MTAMTARHAPVSLRDGEGVCACPGQHAVEVLRDKVPAVVEGPEEQQLARVAAEGAEAKRGSPPRGILQVCLGAVLVAGRGVRYVVRGQVRVPPGASKNQLEDGAGIVVVEQYAGHQVEDLAVRADFSRVGT